MAVTRASFEARFPEFATATLDAYFDIALGDYVCYYNSTCPNDGCNDAAVLQAIAHLIVIDQKASSSSVKDKTAQSADGVSVSFAATYRANPSDTDIFFGTTKYGQRFLQLIRGCGYGAVFV